MFPPWRRQLPVASPLDASMLAGALRDVAAGRDRSSEVRAMLHAQFGGEEIYLTDSGTSALVLALRLVAKPGEIVAMPAYACVDLIAAARYANVRVSLYDIDPHTLSPDLDSVREVLAAPAEQPVAILVAQLYGYPADVPGVRDLAHARGIRVIEDSAQHAGATLHGKPAATTGDVAILSFGRGKGTTGGRGGALIVHASDLAARAREDIHLAPPASGARDLIVATASWALGRPSLYAIPSAIPWLHLGETVYHDAHEPEAMPKAAAALLMRTLREAPLALERRRANAAALRATAVGSRRSIDPLENGAPGFLRFPVVASRMTPRPALGIVRGYRRPLGEEEMLQAILVQEHSAYPGAQALAAALFTLPTHHLMTSADRNTLVRWMQA